MQVLSGQSVPTTSSSPQAHGGVIISIFPVRQLRLHGHRGGAGFKAQDHSPSLPTPQPHSPHCVQAGSEHPRAGEGDHRGF